MQSFELHLPVTQEISAIELLSQHCQLSKQQLKIVLQKGAVWLTVGKKTSRLRRAKKALLSGQTLHLYYNEVALSDDFTKPTLLQDCDYYSVWLKPSGMMSQGSKWSDHSTIARYAEMNLTPQRPAFIVHRLDRATQGIIIVAHSKGAVQALTALFEARNIIKKYQAVVQGSAPQSAVYDTAIDERSAHTSCELLAYDEVNNLSLLDVTIKTGRKHQIRLHLSGAGLPILGDRLYGPVQQEHVVDLQLCSYFLQFDCPLSLQVKTFTIVPELQLQP